jgi:hypothetical protein
MKPVSIASDSVTIVSAGSSMPEVDPRALRAAADAYAAARADYETVKADADAAYERLETSPETIEYQIGWNVACREEAAAAWRLERAEEAYRKAGGHLARSDE